jgi:sugar/nucleoside kinase (ribokinase family)
LKITAVGNPVYDIIETPFVKTKGRVLSGCSTNFCLALAKLGVRTTLVGNVGGDLKQQIVRDLERYGIEHVLHESSQTGGFSLRYFGEHGERELKLLGDAEAITSFPEQSHDSDFVVFGPILGEVDLTYAKRLRKRSDARFILDPQGILRGQRDGMIFHEKQPETEELIGMCEVVKPNELECKVLTGIDPRIDARTPARIIKSWGPDVVIITLAELGSLVYDGHEFTPIPPFDTLAKDSTGAGDTYLGGFMYGFSQGWDLYECGCMGSAVASVMIEHTGPEFPLTLTEATKRKDRLLGLRSEVEQLR